MDAPVRDGLKEGQHLSQIVSLTVYLETLSTVSCSITDVHNLFKTCSSDTERHRSIFPSSSACKISRDPWL